MKRILLIIAVLLTWSATAHAVGTCTETRLGWANLQGASASVYVVKVACVADAAAATIPTETIQNVGGNLIAVYVDFGATAPTTGAYDVLVNADAMADIDLLGAAGVDLTTTADLALTPVVGAVSVPAAFIGDLTLTQTGNAVNSATPTIYLIFSP